MQRIPIFSLINIFLSILSFSTLCEINVVKFVFIASFREISITPASGVVYC
ncbi:hypothetical protein BGAPBR_Q0040 (plasmid) [Borreliella garinii PBr]|uniref:Uncharacterized protein n=1 Tax=Borreliella garinii PBr TaxID=498743 RepID=B8F1B7_BORGR|nr:hypothetical protein BGAPBR_Q0040 [Borreliella garinii PBr]